MNENPLVRQLTIAMITGEQNDILHHFNELWSQLTIIEANVYHGDGGEFIFYIDSPKQWIFYQDNESDRFWCNYDHYWNLWESKFNIWYEDIRDITKLLVESSLANNITTPFSVSSCALSVEDVLGNATPIQHTDVLNYVVEDALNNSNNSVISIPKIRYINPVLLDKYNSTCGTINHALNKL